MRAVCSFLAVAASSLAIAAPAEAAAPKVVVTLKPIHALVSQVMEGIGQPVLIVDGSSSPHTFTLKPSGAKAINEADVFFRVSEGLEPFTRKVAEALPKTVKLVSLADAPGVTVLPQRQGATFEVHQHHAEHTDSHDAHNHDHGDVPGANDGHIWLDPVNAQAIVDQVAKVLAETYPASAEKFAANAAAVKSRIDALANEIEVEVSPFKGRPFVVFHDATQYFENGFGLAAAGSVTISPDVQPSAKRLTEIRKKISELGAVCVFAEPGFQPKLVEAVTGGTTARSGVLDPEGIALSPGPNLYFDLMRTMSRNLTACFSLAS